MQNQHVTPYPNGAEQQQHSLYTSGVVAVQESGNNAITYAIDPSLGGDEWTSSPQPASHQYQGQRYTVEPQYYNPYGQPQPQQQQQPVFQGYSGMAAQPTPYTSYQPQANHYPDPFFAGPSTQHGFANGYDFSAQPSQHETISPQALQVEDAVVRTHFHQRGLSQQQQVFERNAQQENWAQGQPVSNSSAHFPALLNGHVIPRTTSSIVSTPQSSRGTLNYSSYINSVANRAPTTSSFGYDSGNGQLSRGGSLYIPPKNQVLPSPCPHPPRVTHQSLLDQYASEKDVVHRVTELPFAILGESVTQLDIRGKTTIPKYHARGSSMGKKFAPRTDLFATTKSATPTVVKRGRGRPRKDGTINVRAVGSKSAISKTTKARLAGAQISTKQDSPTTPSLESSSGDSSSDGESEEESEEEEELRGLVRLQDVRAAVRPTDDLVAAAKYDAVGIVFKEGIQHGQITREEIIKAVQSFEPFVVKLRDNYRSSVASLQEATVQKRQVQIPRLAHAKIVNYQALTNALSETLVHGHNDIIKNLGTNHKTVVVLWTVLTDFVKADDFASELPLIVLELLAKFTGLTAELLKKLKFEAIQKRIVKKGTEKMKELLAVISRNATEEGKRENDPSTDPGPLQKVIVQPAKESAAPNTTTTLVPRTGMKRSHEGEGANGNPSKKIASGATSTLNPRVTTTMTKTVPRPNVFANLTRPVKTSQASSGGTKTAAKTAPVKPVAKPAPPMTSRFGDILASINAPKEVPKAPVVQEGPPETAEEKKKRERKESRRHLRVKWKEGDELTQVKIFTQVEGEDESRKSELVRDAHDDRSEGMMHKQRAQEEVDIDEDDITGEVEYRPYPELHAIDFSDIDEQQRSKSYTTRGGRQTFSTLQQQIQDRHESTELMVVYTDPSDIPPSAKEPPASDEVDQSDQEKPLGQPTDQWLHQRMQEVRLYGSRRAVELALLRINRSNNNNASQQQNHQFNHSHGYVQQAHITPNMSPDVTPQQLAEAEDLVAKITAKIVSIMGKSFPPTEPPSHMNERQKADWWEGYTRDKALKSSNSTQERSHQDLQQTQQPVMQSYQQPTITPQTQAATFDIESIMRQISATSQTSSQSSQQPVPSIQTPGYDLQSLMQSFGNSNAANQASQQGWSSNNPENMPPYNLQANNNVSWNEGANPQANQNWMQNWDSQMQNQMQWQRTDSGNGPNGNQHNRYRDRDDTRGIRDRDDGLGRKEDTRPKKGYKVGTKPCRFFLEDKCAKGDKCTYLHER